MPNPFAQAGAASDPSRYAPLYTNRFFTGLWSNRNLLRDAATSFLYEKYMGGRFDSVFGGFDMEISARMTWWKRPGHSVYNSQTFPPILSYFPFRIYVNGVTSVKVLVDTATDVFDGTGPNTKTSIWTKQPGAGKTRFLSIGNTLYWMDGVSAKKWMIATQSWQPNTAFTSGQFINDPNGNLQVIEPLTVVENISSIRFAEAQKTGGSPYVPPQYWTHFVVVTVSSNPVRYPPVGGSATFAGLTTATELNGLTLTEANSVAAQYPGLNLTSNQLAFFYSPVGGIIHPDTPDTGTVTFITGAISTSGKTGATPPSWNQTLGGLTNDGGLIWTNFGSAVSDWGTVGPIAAPNVSSTNGVDRYWQPNLALPLYYSVLDANSQLEVVVGNPGPGVSSGKSEPTWNVNLGGYTYDGGLQWIQCGSPLSWSASATVLAFQSIVDSNGNLQVAWAVVAPGATGANPPSSWATDIGDTTVDNNITWMCVGPGTQLATATFQYAYAYHYVDGSVSALSPLATVPDGVLGPSGGFSMTISGITTPAPTCDQIWIYRVAQGGSVPYYLDDIPNPSVGAITTWSYVDILPDTSLNDEIPGTIGVAGNGPPAGATAPCAHLGRVFVLVGNIIQYSTGPDVVPGAGNGNTMFPPLNSFSIPTSGVKLISTTIGLVVITVSDVRLIAGEGTESSPLVPPVLFLEGTGALSYDAITMQNSTIYMMTSVNKGLALDPGSGVIEVGEPIGDLLETSFNPATTFVTWHESTSRETALYYADGQTGWYRMAQLPAPEDGYCWSVKANVQGGTSAVQSVEVTPGQRKLLVGPQVSGPILFRDTTTNADNGAVYPGQVQFGNIVLAQHGEVAEIVFIGYDVKRVGSRPGISVLLGELSGTFESLPRWTKDPPILPHSKTLYSERHYMMQNQEPVWCRHLQVEFDFPAENAASEIYTYSVFGALHNERSVPQ